MSGTPPVGQSCDSCKFLFQRWTDPNFYYECHFDPPRQGRETANLWPQVKLTEWCGDWEQVGAKAADQYLHGALALQDMTVMTLLTLPAASIADNVVMRACQLLNT